jgi:hypothetical protein
MDYLSFSTPFSIFMGLFLRNISESALQFCTISFVNEWGEWESQPGQGRMAARLLITILYLAYYGLGFSIHLAMKWGTLSLPLIPI